MQHKYSILLLAHGYAKAVLPVFSPESNFTYKQRCVRGLGFFKTTQIF